MISEQLALNVLVAMAGLGLVIKIIQVFILDPL